LTFFNFKPEEEAMSDGVADVVESLRKVNPEFLSLPEQLLVREESGDGRSAEFLKIVYRCSVPQFGTWF